MILYEIVKFRCSCQNILRSWKWWNFIWNVFICSIIFCFICFPCARNPIPSLLRFLVPPIECRRHLSYYFISHFLLVFCVFVCININELMLIYKYILTLILCRFQDKKINYFLLNRSLQIRTASALISHPI